jgi:hypothetical protein
MAPIDREYAEIKAREFAEAKRRFDRGVATPEDLLIVQIAADNLVRGNDDH